MTDTPRQTVVLVHGAYADSSSWNGSIDALQQAGHRVIAAANPLRGIAEDAAYLRSVLDGIDGPIVLAEPGETLVELVEKFPGAELGGAAQAVPYPTPDGGTAPDLYIDPERFPALFAGDVDADVARRMAVTQRPLTLAAFEAPSTRAAWTSIESSVLAARQDLAVPAELSRWMAERANAHLVEIDASHAVTVSQPGAVADLVLEAAETTAR